MILAYQYLPIYDKDKDIGYVEPAETRDIVAHVLPPYVNFDITSIMIQLLHLKGAFSGLKTDDENMYLSNFIGMCTSYTIPWVNQKALRLQLFPFMLIGEVLLWLGELPRGSIITWNEILKQFLNQFFPPTRIL